MNMHHDFTNMNSFLLSVERTCKNDNFISRLTVNKYTFLTFRKVIYIYGCVIFVTS